MMRTLASVEFEIMLILGLPCCLSSSSVRCLENVGYEDAIVVPPINANNFKLKQTLINLVQSNQFTGRQDPHNHLRFFNKCPHHGFSELHQLDTFYNALNPNDQDALDSAAGGNFLDKIPHECLSIIESKSKVRYSRRRVTDVRSNTNVNLSSSQSNSFDLQQIAASLEDKLDIRMNRFEKSLNEMKNSIVTPTAPLKEVTEVCVTCGSNHSYNQCPLTRGGNDYLVFHDNIQQFQTAAVGRPFLSTTHALIDVYEGEITLRDMLIFEELLSYDSLSLHGNESFHFDISSFAHPPAKPPDDDSGILTIKMMGDISEHDVPMPKFLPTQPTLISNQDKSPHLLSHRGFKAS
nr:hypothetical protein [Tanacetum cinerariifolium]